MAKIAKILAREWLTLTGGIVVGFLLIPLPLAGYRYMEEGIHLD